MTNILSPEKGTFTFTVGKLDAGMAILIGSRAHLIEFPSVLLPEGVIVGSIVNIDVVRNLAEEEHAKSNFWKLQNDIYTSYGIKRPIIPELKLRHVTQTSVTLEWPTIELATATLRSLDIYRNGQRLASIPNPLTNTSTKLSGLQTNTGYTFQLIMKTTAGTFPSNVINVKTQTLEDTSGISVCFGTILDSDVGGGGAVERTEELKRALDSMGAKWSEKIQIDTTHFVCTTSLSLTAVARGGGSAAEESGVEYQKAIQLSIPIVQPDWVLACFYQKKMVPTAPYYLGTTVPPLQQGHARVHSISQQSQPLPPNTPNTTASAPPVSRRGSQPPRSAASAGARTDSPRGSTSTPPPPKLKRESGSNVAIAATRKFGEAAAEATTPTTTVPPITTTRPKSQPPNERPVPSLPVTTTDSNSITNLTDEDLRDEEDSPTTPSASNRRKGTMNKAFKFPPDGGKVGVGKTGGLSISPPPPMPTGPPIIVVHEAKDSIASMKGTSATSGGGGGEGVKRVMPEPPTPDMANGGADDVRGRGRRESDADVGDIVEVDLS